MNNPYCTRTHRTRRIILLVLIMIVIGSTAIGLACYPYSPIARYAAVVVLALVFALAAGRVSIEMGRM